MSLRIVMMGTGSFAVPVFTGLYESRHVVAGLFTQPGRTGRGHHRHQNLMKDLAEADDTPVLQPADVNVPDSIDALRSLHPDLCVVAAYGQILSPELIATPRLGAINVHASLLPKYRGAAPVHYAILNGERETGITIFQIEPKGYELAPVVVTSGELEERLAEFAVPLMLRVIDAIETGTIRPIDQNPAKATRAPSLRKTAGFIDWSMTTDRLLCHIRAMQPWPSPYTFLLQSGRKPLRLIVLDADPVDRGVTPPGSPAESSCEAAPGTFVYADGERMTVRTGDGAVDLIRIRPEGKREMTAAEFLRGHRIAVGDRLAESDVRS